MGNSIQIFDTFIHMELNIGEEWRDLLESELKSDYFNDLIQFIENETRQFIVYPPYNQIFRAFYLTPPSRVKVVIIGQDPYHGPGQANGLSFSVNEGAKLPPSLLNIFKELKADLGVEIPKNGNLENWAQQGVLLLNATLTVRAANAGSHQNKGWEKFTDAAIKKLVKKNDGIVFMLWGAYAQQKVAIIPDNKHLLLLAPHPSPLSAYKGFLGCQHFSKANSYLINSGKTPINWGEIS